LEAEVLADLLASDCTGAVVACGGGVIGDEGNRALIKTSGLPVVWLKRDFAEIERYLEAEGARPAYGESTTDVYHRRLPWYTECSTCEFELPAGTSQVGGRSADSQACVTDNSGRSARCMTARVAA